MVSFAQIAYESYCAMYDKLGLGRLKTWDSLSSKEQNCWDAAAQAVVRWDFEE